MIHKLLISMYTYTTYFNIISILDYAVLSVLLINKVFTMI